MGSNNNPSLDNSPDKEILLLRKRLQHKEEEIEELKKLLYIASHDIRSPLISILGFADELEMISSDIRDAFTDSNDLQVVKDKISNILNTDAKESIEYVTNSVQSLDIIIRSLLTLSRAAHSDVSLSAINTDLLLNRIRLEFASRMEMLGTTLDIQDNLPDCIANENLLGRIFEIIIENSLVHLSASDKSHISIKAEKIANEICYRIYDKNSTLSQKNADEAFHIFRKLNPAKQEGAGIGLSEARILARKMNGRITIESIPNQGVCVSTVFPSAELL